MQNVGLQRNSQRLMSRYRHTPVLRFKMHHLKPLVNYGIGAQQLLPYKLPPLPITLDLTTSEHAD